MRKQLFITGMCLVLSLVLRSQEELFEFEKARFLRGQSEMALLNGTNASPDFRVDHYLLQWEIDPAVRFISGRVTATITITSATNTIRFDLSDSLWADSILFRGSRITHSRPGNNSLQISFPSTLSAGTRDSLVIFYRGVPTASGFGAITFSTHAGTPIIWTLSEPYGSREWWPCRNGLDDKADSIDVVLTVPEIYFGTTNGVQTGESVTNGKRTTTWKHRYPIATYLVAIAATNYQIQQDTIQLNGKNLPLQQYVYPESFTAWQSAIPDTRRLMRLFEQHFGPYPFRNERYAHTQVGFGGGMEHQTNSWMGSTNQTLIAHELAHQWFGDRVTCGSWQDIWLNEGYAVLLSYMNIESQSSLQDRINFYRNEIRLVTSRPGGSVFVRDTSSVGSIFDYRLTYVKAAWVLKMLRWKLGEQRFYEASRRYLEDTRVSYGFARTDDLKRNFEAVSGQDLDEYFDDWLYGEGYPSYQLTWLPLGNKLQYVLNQTTSHPSVDFFEMPVPVQFRNATRDTVIVINHTRNGQSGIINLGFVPDTAFIDPQAQLISANNSTAKAPEDGNRNSIRVFPNPIGDQFSLLLRNFSRPDVRITVHNALGQLLWKQELRMITSSDLITVPSSTWPKGVYLLRINNGDINDIRRLVK